MDWFVKKTIKNVLFTAVAIAVIHFFLSGPGRFIKYTFFLLVAIAVICYLRYLVPLRRAGKGFPYVYVEKDGTVRELSGDEMEYLATEFSPGDGARPAIKLRYAEKNGWGSISGFIPRNRVPARIPIARCFSTRIIVPTNLLLSNLPPIVPASARSAAHNRRKPLI